MDQAKINEVINFFANQLNALNNTNKRTAGYLARMEYDRLIAPLKADPKRLEPYGFKVYSQGDEDGIIEEIARRINIDIRGGGGEAQKPLSFVEIGVENGLECNSLYLLHKGWRGIWIEANPKQQEPIKNKFASLLNNGRLKLNDSFVTPENINELITVSGLNEDLDLLSIDIDGNDIYLLNALQIRPKIIVIEYNAKFPAHLDKRPVYPAKPWRGTDFMGSSLKAITKVANDKGYQLVGTNILGTNAFFVRSDLAAGLFSEPATSEHLYNPPRYHIIWDAFNLVGHPADFGEYCDLQ